MKDTIKKRKKQGICILTGFVLGTASYISSQFDQTVKEGYYLDRKSYGQGEASYQLLVKGIGEEEIPLEILVGERSYTEEEAHLVYEKILQELPFLILQENESLNSVRSDLNLISRLEPYGVSLRWQSEDVELLDSFGKVYNEELDQDGKSVGLRVRMTDGNTSEEFLISVQILPPLLTAEEQRKKELKELVSLKDRQQRQEKQLELPRKLQGQDLSYREQNSSSFWTLVLLGGAGALLFTIKEKKDLKQKEEARRGQMLLDYSEVLSRLIIFLGAGMSIRTAWDKIAEDYYRHKKMRGTRHVYEEMYAASCQIKSGISESRAYSEFGRRCGLSQYMKLSSLLEQNRKNGSKNLRETLRLEMAEAFEQRKHQARRLGEEAGTKLLIPLFMLLSVVMIMIAVPALMEFG